MRLRSFYIVAVCVIEVPGFAQAVPLPFGASTAVFVMPSRGFSAIVWYAFKSFACTETFTFNDACAQTVGPIIVNDGIRIMYRYCGGARNKAYDLIK